MFEEKRENVLIVVDTKVLDEPLVIDPRYRNLIRSIPSYGEIKKILGTQKPHERAAKKYFS